MIRIRFPNELEACIEAGQWSCEDSRVERLLNAMRAPWDAQNTNDRHDAEIASKVLGVEILELN